MINRMILEGIVTTRNDDGSVNVAPMGPIVDAEMTRFQFRPFKTSQTYHNLKNRLEGVFHVVDDVLLIAQTAIGRLQKTPPTMPATLINGNVLKNACRWYEFKIEQIDDKNDRTSMTAITVYTGKLRNFFGFQRAKHAVLEAAILATRLHIIPKDELMSQFAALAIIVEKTAGPEEKQAFELLNQHLLEHFRPHHPKN